MLDSSLECSIAAVFGDGITTMTGRPSSIRAIGPVLELAGGEPLGVHVRQFLELERTLERDRVADVPAQEQHGLRLANR